MATLVISLNTSTKPVSKLGFLVRGVLLFMSMSGLIYLGVTFANSILFLSVLTFASVFLLLFFSKRYFEKIFFTEKIIVSYSKMTIIYRTFLKEVKHEFLLRDVQYLSFSDDKNLKNEIPKKALVNLIDSATMQLETEKQIFCFGKNISRREAAEIIKKIEDHLGRKFMEKQEELLYS